MDTSTQASAQIMASISNGNDYKANSPKVLEALASGAPGYIPEFVKTTWGVLSADPGVPAGKFYALYLLSKAMEDGNPELAYHIAKERSLLEILFKDAQTDGQKVMKDKGKKFFSKAPKNDEAVLGNNYMRLMLENFIHWSKIYVTEDKKNPLVLYTVMLTNLQGRVKFPDDLLYLTKEHNITNDFHLKPASSLVPIQSSKPASPPKKTETISDTERTEIHKQMLLTVPSGRDYKNHSPKIFQYIKKNSKPLNAVILAEIYEILNSKTYPATFKFYALLLLVKITETNDQTFASQLAEDKELLAKLSNDAKVDKDKPKPERGRTLFPGSAQESVVGSNYHTLVIESIQFWAESFLPSSKNESFVKFSTVYSTLLGTQGVEFAKDNYFVKKTLRFEEDEQDKSLSKRDLYGQAKKSNDEATMHLKAAITSGNDYQANSGRIFSNVGRNSKDYISSYMRATTAILKARDTPPVQQFYATYLLVKLTETKNDMLVNELANSQELLDDLFQKAQFDRTKEPSEKGITFFSQNPREDESKLGHNYLTLLQEAFVYWRQTFNPINKKDATAVFNTIYSNLEKRTKLPDQLYFVGKNPNTDNAHFPKKFELTLADDLSSSTKPKPTENKPPLNKPSGFGSEDVAVKKMKEGLGRYETTKLALKEFLENNAQEDKEMRDILIYLSKDVGTSYKNDVTPNIEPLLSSTDPQAEKYVTQAFEEGATVDRIDTEVAGFEKNKKGYSEFRRNVLPLLHSGHQEPASGSPQRTTTPTGINISQNRHEPEEQIKSSAVHLSPEKIEQPVRSERSLPELQIQRFYAQELAEDIDSAKLKGSATGNLKTSEVISRDYGAHKAPIHDESEEEFHQAAAPMHQSHAVRGVQQEHQGHPHEEFMYQHFRAGDLEEDYDDDVRQSTVRSSLRMSPSKKAFTEGDDMRNSMKLSRVKANELTNIESSIRNSFVNTGKKPPQFKPLNELQVKEELEREIARLKAEKDQLQKENNKLNTMLKHGAGSEDDKALIEDLKLHLDQHQQWVEALQEENTALRNELENMRAHHAYEDNPDEGKKILESKIKNLEAELANARANPQAVGNTKALADLENENQALRDRIHELETGHRDQPRPKKASPPKQNELNYMIEDDEDDGTDRFETPLNDSGAGQTNYDIDWASQTQPRHPEPSEYDVDWPAHQKEKTESEWEIQRALNTKRAEEPKLIRGRIIDSNNPVFNDLKKDVKGLPFSNDLHSFKIACLKPKCPLFENPLIRVGVSSTVVHDHTNHKNMLKLVLYFENKSDQFIEEFLTDFSQAKSLNRIAKPGRLETFIDSGKQVKQQVIVAFDKVPFECLQLYATVKAADNTDTFSLFLPTLITKFMEFKYVNADVFRERWKMKSNNILRSEEIIVNPAIMKTAYDFKKYFGYLIDLKPMDEYDFVQGKKSIKLGGLFELDVPNTEYLLKINVLPSHQVVFQIATFEAESNTAAFLIQALVFLFKKT